MVKQTKKRESVEDTAAVARRTSSSIDKRRDAGTLRGKGSRCSWGNVENGAPGPCGTPSKRTPKGTKNKENDCHTPGGCSLLSHLSNPLEAAGLLPFGRAASDAAEALVDLYQSVITAAQDATAGNSQSAVSVPTKNQSASHALRGRSHKTQLAIDKTAINRSIIVYISSFIYPTSERHVIIELSQRVQTLMY